MLYMLSRVHCCHSIVYMLKWPWTTIDTDTAIMEDELHSACDVQLVYLGGQIYGGLRLLPMSVAPKIMVHAMDVTLPLKSRRGQCKPLDLSVLNIVEDCAEELNNSPDGTLDNGENISTLPLALTTSDHNEGMSAQESRSLPTVKTSTCSSTCSSNQSGLCPEHMDLPVYHDQAVLETGLTLSTELDQVSADNNVPTTGPTIHNNVDVKVEVVDENVGSEMHMTYVMLNLHKLATNALKRAFPDHDLIQIAKLYTDRERLLPSQSMVSRKPSSLGELCTQVLSTTYPHTNLDELLKTHRQIGSNQVIFLYGSIEIDFEEYLKQQAWKKVSVIVSKLDLDIIKL